jgi:hypothetical protein
LTLAARNGLDAVGYVIAGAPFQQPTDSIKDLLFLARRRVLAGVSLFYPAPGSSDFERCRRLNLLPKVTAGYRSSALPVVYPTSRIAAVTILRLGRVVNFIKALIDAGNGLPPPQPFRPAALGPPRSRTAVGRRLLAWFLHDGRIRGTTPHGDILTHPTDRDLCRQFIQGLQAAPIRGHRRF